MPSDRHDVVLAPSLPRGRVGGTNSGRVGDCGYGLQSWASDESG